MAVMLPNLEHFGKKRLCFVLTPSLPHEPRSKNGGQSSKGRALICQEFCQEEKNLNWRTHQELNLKPSDP
jgi:hypothetical protein